MITDIQTNFVYFSDKLNSKQVFSAFCSNLKAILDEHSINYGFLQETNDIWCRDYMPIQISEDRFIEYRYDPDYLQSKAERKSKSYPDLICNAIGLKTIKSDLILDGGNVIKGENFVIMTDKVIPENSSRYKKAELISKLENTFEVERVILIPWLSGEEFGHADGMLRLVDKGTALLDGYYLSNKSAYSKKLLSILEKNKIDVVAFNFNIKPQSNHNWGYVNFLLMKDILLFPVFNIAENTEALQKIREVFPEYENKGRICPIDASSIIKYKGALNCISWNIKR